jgi:hypothetical protein
LTFPRSFVTLIVAVAAGIANDDDGLSPCMAMLFPESALDEREQVGVDDVGMRRWHAVRVVLTSSACRS